MQKYEGLATGADKMEGRTLHRSRRHYTLDRPETWGGKLRARFRAAWDASCNGGLWLYLVLLTNPFYTAGVAVVGAGVGLWAALYADDIKQSVPPHPLNWAAVSSLPSVVKYFWLAFVIFFFMFVFQQHAQKVAGERANSTLLKESGDLRKLVRQLQTLPPSGFLDRFNEFYAEVVGLYSTRFTDVAQVESAVQTVLMAFVGLATAYDVDGEKADYSANIMLAWNASELADAPASTIESIEKRLVFCPTLRPPKVRALGGVLDLVPSLSVQSNPDAPAASAIALPVPFTTEVELSEFLDVRLRVLPGAPYTAVFQRAMLVPNRQHLFDWCEAEAAIDDADLDEMQKFFQRPPGNRLGSFICLPIIGRMPIATPAAGAAGRPTTESVFERPGEIEETLVTLGVLNIDRTLPNMFGGDMGLFVPVVGPFMHLITHLVAEYLQLKNSEPAPTLDI